MGKKENKTKKAPKTAAEKFDLFWLVWNLVEAFILLGAGVASIIGGVLYKKNEGNVDTIVMQNVLPFVVGSFVIMDGVLRTVMTLLKKKKEGEESVVLVAGFELTAGIVLMLVHNVFTDIMVYFVSVLLIVIGSLFILFSGFTIKRHASKLFIPILEIIFSAILVAVGVGIIVMYLQPDSNNQVVLIIAGTVMTIAAITLGVSAIISTHKRAKERNQVEVVDGNSFDQKDSKRKGKAKEETQVTEIETVIDTEPADEPKQIEEK